MRKAIKVIPRSRQYVCYQNTAVATTLEKLTHQVTTRAGRNEWGQIQISGAATYAPVGSAGIF